MIFLLLPVFAIMALAYFCVSYTMLLFALHAIQLLAVPYATTASSLLLGIVGGIISSFIWDELKKLHK